MVVRMRSTKGHRNNRRSHDGLSSPAVTTDKASGVPHLRHRASLVTGKYKGRVVLDIQKKLDKRTKKAKANQKEGR
jgi:large subunit ribosomal protein L32